MLKIDFLSIFFKKFNKPNKFFGNVEKILKRFLKKMAKNALLTLAPAEIFAGGDARSTKGGLVRGSPRGGFRGRSPPDAGEVFKKLCKKAMKNYNF